MLRQPQTLSFVLIAIVLVALVWPHQTAAKSTSDSSESSDEDAKQLRRTEISRALGLLKKHSVVGKNAKIVLKTSGKNLLVDPSERLQVVTSHASSTDTKAAASSSNALSSKSNKSNKLKEETNNKKAKAASSAKSVTRKRASGRTNKEMSPRTATAKPTSVSSQPSTPSSLSAIQKSIMDNAASKSASIVDSLMGPVMLDEITRMVTAIVRNKRAQSLVHLSDLVTETLDERFGPHWHTVSVATAANQPSTNHNEVLATSIKDNQNQLDSLTHVAIDDHRKTATFYVTYDFGRTLRVYIFK